MARSEVRWLLVAAGLLGVWRVSAAEPPVRAIDGNEWQDMTRMSLGREKTRAAFAPFADAAGALAILPWKSSRQICLDSTTAWRFRWSKDPASRPVGFERPDYDVSSWETIRVPCSWQAFEANGKGGWGKAIYTNATYPFKCNPPRVMDEPPRHYTSYAERNPVGSYRRDFEVPADWAGDRVFLKFDGVDSFYYLWVNGRYVGFTKDSRCAAEYDVTDFVRPGRNVVALEVYRYSDGSYLEDQDMFRLSGILRSCWLVRRPPTRIADFFARARPVAEGAYDGDWALDVESELASATGKAAGEVKVSLYDLADRPVALTPRAGTACSFTVKTPKLWSPETPNCYKLVLSLVRDGRTLECVSTLFGFRESRIINGRYCLNGQKVKLHGANRHETDPRYGHYVPHERQEEDVRLLKRANCNMVRNSHYPQDDYWYYLCNLNGICLMDEANVECHGYWRGGNDPMFRTAMVWRNMNMVERNKNHPAIVFWSHGNESGPGANFRAADDAVHARDRSRPTHYEGDWSNSDVDSNMYPSVGLVWRHARDARAKRPYYICEYAHNMMNAMGNLKDYEDAIQSSDVVIGGTIWDWVDQGLYKLNKDGVKIIAYGGDFGDQPNSGQFVMNGCILSDRSLEPGYFEVKHVYQPVSVTLDAGAQQVTVFNKQFFRGLGVYDATCTVYVNGRATATEKLNLDSVPPRGQVKLPVPAAARSAVAPGATVSVRYQFAAREQDGCLEKGYVVADDQVDLPNPQSAAPFKTPAGKATCERTAESLVFTAGDVRLAFCLKTGALSSYRVRGEERFLAPMTLDAFRAPSSNEVGPACKWSECGWRAFASKVVSCGAVEEEAGALAFTLQVDHEGAAREEIHGFGFPGGRLVTTGRKPAKTAPTFRTVQRWRIYGDGTATCQSEIRPQRGLRAELPRLGYHFTLPLAFGQVEWFGRGPFENYRDRKSGAFRGLWRTNLADFAMPYARPEDANNFEETDAVTLGGDAGALGFATLGAPFAFAAIPYSAQELVNASHPVELPKPAKVEFGLFAETRGLGGASCGPGPLSHDIIDTTRPYRLDFALLPHAASTALAVPPAELPPAEAQACPFKSRKLVSVTSEQGGDERASNAFDGRAETIWHSKWNPTADPYPHAIVCDYESEMTLSGLALLARQDGGNTNGRVKGYRAEVSVDGQNWTVADEGELPNTDDLVELRFRAPVAARYLRFTALSPQTKDQSWASFAEIQPICDGAAKKAGPDLAGRIYLGSMPSLGGDGSRFVFEWNDSIWIAPVAGGTATQLTSDNRDCYPLMSPDGTRVAFTSDRDSGNKAFEIDLSTSGIRQLSHHSESTLARAWCPDGSNLLCRVSRDHAEPRRSSRIAIVPTVRRAAERILFDVSADDPSMSTDGTRILFTYRGDNLYRKRPNSFSSEAGEIWMYDLKRGEFTALVTDKADSRNPLWAPDGKGFYYLNAAGGARNVYYQSLEQGPAGRPAPVKLTDFGDDHVFQPTISPDGRTMVFRQAFDFWRLRLGAKGAKPERIDLRTPAGYVPRPQTRRRWLTSCWNLDEDGDVTFCDNGMQIAMTVGGDLFVMDTVMREPRCVRPSPLTKERDCIFSRDGSALYFLSDRGDGTDLWKAERTEADKPWWRNRAFRFTRLTYDDECRVNLKLSPDGSTFAWQTSTGQLVFADANGHVRTRGPKVAEGGSYVFSPDGKFVASQYRTRDGQYDVAVVSTTENEKSWILTRNFNYDASPAWSPDGKVIAFTSERPEIAGGNLLCYVYLDAALEEREAKEARRIRSADDTVRDNSASSGAKKDDKKKDDKKKDGEEKRPVPFEELADRVRVTRVSGWGLFFNPDGRTLLFNSGSETKAIRIPDKLDPWRVCGKTGTVVDWIKKDRTERVLRVVGNVPAHGETTFGFSAYLENTDIADYQELVFRTAWGRIRDRYYDPNCHGRDWPAVRAKYLPYARNAGSMSVFTRVIKMMLGELDSSHLAFFQNDSSRKEWDVRANAPRWNAETAHLGIRFDPAHRGAGWKIRDVVRGSPADRVELGFKPGDLVTAVNGVKVDSGMDPTLVLNGPGKRLVTVTVNGRDHEIRATSYGEIRKLLEAETFRDRRKFTHEKSKGRFGYLNIRDMDAESLGRFKYEVYNEGYGREGLLIDVRDNHGGYTADQILMTIFGAQHSFAVTREGGPGYLAGYWTRPVWYRPIVVLCNEDSGSNAEIFSHAIHQLGRGKLVGRPTGGNVIATSNNRILDFGEFRDAKIGFFLLDGTDMEHHGAPVDFHVDDLPPDVNRGIDRQLEKAIEVLGVEVEDWKRKNPAPRMKYVSVKASEQDKK